jgi:hypothetical protein
VLKGGETAQIRVDRRSLAPPHRCLTGRVANAFSKAVQPSSVAALSRPAAIRYGRGRPPLTGKGARGTVMPFWARGPQGQTGMAGRIASVIASVALVLALSVLVLSLTWVSQPRAANVLEKNFWLSGPRYDRDIPACDFPPALDWIISDFKTKEARFWNSALGIVGIENIHETAELAWAAQSIPRRFCSGTALINDGVRHPIYYSIAEDTGMIGSSFGIEFCVVGLDRNFAYGPACRAARR